MKYDLFFDQRADCAECKDCVKSGFKQIRIRPGEHFLFEEIDLHTVVFFLSGEALVFCNEYREVRFTGGQICLWPMNSVCGWQSLAETEAIILVGDNEHSLCDRKSLREEGYHWFNTVPEFTGMQIKPRLMEFLSSVRNYLQDGITCPLIHHVKQRELSVILRAYYSPQEIANFFVPTIKHTTDFEWFVMNNYLKIKGVKEFAELSGMNLSMFNRKFKAHFNKSPYQWIIEHRAKHIFHALSATDKNFVSIAKEFYFADTSHLNRYCKHYFGASPSVIRNQWKKKREDV